MKKLILISAIILASSIALANASNFMPLTNVSNSAFEKNAIWSTAIPCPAGSDLKLAKSGNPKYPYEYTADKGMFHREITKKEYESVKHATVKFSTVYKSGNIIGNAMECEYRITGSIPSKKGLIYTQLIANGTGTFKQQTSDWKDRDFCTKNRINCLFYYQLKN
tara:strand:+ start:663 stop:1157 length:495 start_codon:yes stop_codon:yes gene_type:complete